MAAARPLSMLSMCRLQPNRLSSQRTYSGMYMCLSRRVHVFGCAPRPIASVRTVLQLYSRLDIRFVSSLGSNVMCSVNWGMLTQLSSDRQSRKVSCRRQDINLGWPGGAMQQKRWSGSAKPDRGTSDV